jgi:tripartite-type tricarboxylate transporter receptor subunit TctC
LSAAILALSLFLVHPGHAQPYPARPVKIIVPTVAGGTVDVITRLIANDLSSRLGVSFFVDNRSGAGNTLGSREAARAAAPATRSAHARPRAASPTATPC